MSSQAIPRPPRLATCSGLEPLPPRGRWLLRGGAAVHAAAGALLDWPLPSQGRAAGDHEHAALWLGPEEFLLLDPPQLPVLQAALAPLPHSLVEVSQRQTAFTVSGAARLALNAACPLDLDVEVFTVGACTRTVFGKAEVVLWRIAPDIFHVEVWRSFAMYVTQLLAQAASEV
ncbi:MAG TPA: sarcosine oxidase subunit gamma family protein [Steroidobacteraceae bacterium]|jgi:sarcosine oxidase subunit gamma|nr:sarcosine oxidase subunit gamma family protein [Steroidobacteraceae bacterium]